ncbi:fatty acid desaturase-domain-containing protein [Exophiala viscosa]|uniref:Delta 8-(E)-sphingolipid desaturase n=1 Tax=Exophiala viscosa TaxID=2486360 RepID=A0AAN6I9K9_9EURO|nr:fatty acid desaturase-domain-containing protein [Exophiala viscosa]
MSFRNTRHERRNSMSPEQIQGLVSQGYAIVIMEDTVLKLDTWMKSHPGGEKAILHQVGKDATVEINAFHNPTTRAVMQRYQIGTVQLPWKNLTPPIQTMNLQSSDEADQSLVVDDCEQRVVKDLGFPERPEKRVESDHPASLGRSTTHVVDNGARQPLSHIDVQTRETIDLKCAHYPAVDAGTQKIIIDRYQVLEEELHARGIYDCNYSAYAFEAARCAFLFGLMLVALKHGWLVLSGIFMGFFWQQLVFAAHDAGHNGITHDYRIDSLIAMTIANHLGGLSMGWWKQSHNIHHIVTNEPEHDPDIQHLPFFAISSEFFGSIYSTYYERIMQHTNMSKYFLPYQAYYYYLILALGRFNLYALSWEYLIRGQGPRQGPAWWHRWYEISGQLFFWTWFGYYLVYKGIPTGSGRLVFVLTSHMVTMPLHVQFTLSHFAMDTKNLGPQESFPQKMLRSTMDIDCPPWLDFFHGGLQFQAVHHLFPRLPRHNLRAASKLVQQFCREVEIPYAMYGFVDGNKAVLSRLDEIGGQVAIMEKCRRVLAEAHQS